MIMVDNGEVIHFNEDTGEVMETYSVPYKHPEEVFKEPYDASRMTCKQDVVDYFKEEMFNPTIKVRWTNWAIDDLLAVDHRIATAFKKLSKSIVARNIVFEKSSDLCDIMDIHKSDLSKFLNNMKQSGLIREFKGHSGKRGWRYLEMNPTIVFKTYQQTSNDFNYSSSSRFNTIHTFYVKKWVQDCIDSNTYIGKS